MPASVADLERRIRELKLELTAARRALPHTPVKSYHFTDAGGNPIEFASLFGDKDDLILIHNMGRRCVYCTLWADGFNGLAQHLQSRAAFVLACPDDPETMRRFAEARGWTFPVVSTIGSTFSHDMGYQPAPDQPLPGVSGFLKRPDGTIARTGTTSFGPGDDFCSIWPLFDLLATTSSTGSKEVWQPRYTYP